ncbi:hypothetical protein C3747_1g109 [Trypanosoma cruzi]|uniref:Uncharacterized protein n=2 Tax=Trypanosoma cruzi TaxID=5693 RepID=Q4DLF7_TRYCC|nr:hypothetical protein, conserved [Trypanosoma cruzi]EAN93362.1 hypothetical protein, conserved [Trypanosoma cruzi]KAF8298623.1 hypothetical protein TcYC6_0068640 [Trypanosoma cruzi]PWV21893.1 hypothetical protein C3747_1g109 [Trypanosoma cruzi]RNC62109.1 hypothetical protein TcCL_ESM00124 [Trypanosoma cruzi]|eukprot:XP_815213.1 hypothetical protein [Trypanosoma cruzi strain CL Brener]
MSLDDIDAFRAELLRQKIIFEAELRRQRETFEERLSRLSQELADREADCRNLQAVVTILGKKVENLMDRHMATPHRRSSPARPASSSAVSGQQGLPARISSSSTRQSSPFRRNNNFSAPASGAPVSTFHAPSLSSLGSCQNSPARISNGRRPKLGNEGAPDHHPRRVGGTRL